MREFAGNMTSEPIDRVFRAAAMKAHPDTGGNADIMGKINRCREYIEKKGHQ